MICVDLHPAAYSACGVRMWRTNVGRSYRRCAKSSLIIWWRAIAASCGCELTARAPPGHLDVGAFTLAAVDSQSSPDGCDALAHDAQSQVPGRARLRLEATPVVAYPQPDAPGGGAGQLHERVFGTRVFDDVVQGFLCDAIQDDLD